MKPDTLYAQICDVLDRYRNREIHISDTASLCEEVALKFAKGFLVFVEPEYTHTTDELLTLYKEHLSLTQSENKTS